ncbi:MAG TPA: helix-turn-helix transcriptional regulator [Acidimicrobiia bacterium]|nr:helix-turn-helix transcriptional regulator [Acidimicrobiia bacterium]
MSVAIFSLIVVNSMMFGMLGVRAFVQGRKADSPYLRALAWVVSGACAAFVLGAAQRLAVQAVTAGWLPDIGLSELTNEWQLVQSVAAFSIAVAGLWTLSRTWGPIRLSQQVASTLAGRLPDVDLEECDLTTRERQVVDVIGRGQLSDREIAEALFIAPTTAATHVKRILRKTGLTSRRDLLLLFLAKDR